MRTAEFLLAKDPERDRAGDMMMACLVMSLARSSVSVRYIGMGPESVQRAEGRLVPKGGVRRASLVVRATTAGHSLVHQRFDTVELRDAVEASDADIFVADHAYMAESFLSSGRREPLYTSTVVSESMVWAATYGMLGRLQAPAILRDELRVAQASVSVGTYDNDEAEFYRRSGHDRAQWLSVTLPPLTDLPERNLSAPRLAFVGDRRWRPNAEGFETLLRLWPRISAGVPGAELVIVGSAGAQVRRPIPAGIIDLGFVPDLAGLLATCRGILAPIHTGGGVRVKILEAASRGIPVVGTPAAIGSLDGVLGLTACTTEAEFIDAARRMLTDADHARGAGEDIAAHNRAHWEREEPQRSVEQWLLP